MERRGTDRCIGKAAQPGNRRALARHALESSGLLGAKKLVIFDNIRPHEEFDSDVGTLLRQVAAGADTCVLAVIEYNDNSRSDWDVAGATIITSPVAIPARKRFIDDLIARMPELAPGTRAYEAAGTVQDLRYITQLLVSDNDPISNMSACMDKLGSNTQQAVLTAAAMSLAGSAVPSGSLDDLEMDERIIFGVIPGRWPGTSMLTGQRDCIGLLRRCAQERLDGAPLEDRRDLSDWRRLIYRELLQPVLEDLLREASADHAPRVPALFSGIWLSDQRLARDLAMAMSDQGMLTSWASAVPTRSVIDLMSIRQLLDDEVVLILARLVMRKLDGEPPWQPGSLLMLARTIRSLDAALDDDVLSGIANWLQGQVEMLLDQNDGRPEDLCSLMEVLARYDWRDDVIKQFVADRALDVLKGLRYERLGDYMVVRRVMDLQRMLRDRDEIDLAAVFVEYEQPVQAMLRREPSERDGIQVLFAAINLRQNFDWIEYEIRFRPFHLPMTASLATATAAELATAINSLRRSNPRLATVLISQLWPEFAAAARRLLERAWPAEAAALIRAIAQTNSLQLPLILRISGSTDRVMMVSLARKIKELRDTTSAGFLLSALHEADDLFHRGHELAATVLAEQIGASTAEMLISYDPRMASLYHLVRGIWSAEASYREDLLGTVLDTVADHVRRRRQHWGPLTALRMLADVDFGDRILEGLRERLSPNEVLRGMVSGATVLARAALHRLGRVLYPQLAGMYRDQWDKSTFLEGLKSDAAALGVCAETAITLIEADATDPGRQILDATGGVEEWARRLHTGARPHLFATGLGAVSDLDNELAVNLVARLRSSPTRFRIQGRTVSSLTLWLRKAMLIDASTTAAVIVACDRVEPGLARELMEELGEDGYASYALHWSAAYDQNPISQSQSMRALVRAGLKPENPRCQWIRSVYGSRLDTLSQFTSPKARAAILHMFAAWNPQWAIDAANSFDVVSMTSRVQAGRLADFAGIVDLIRTLEACGGSGAARRLAESLSTTGLDTLGRHVALRNLCELADVLDDVLPEAVPKVLASIDIAVQASVTNAVVFDEGRAWQDVARAAATARRLGRRLAPLADPVLRPNVVHAPAVAWVAAEFGDPRWGEKAADRMRRRLTEREFTSAVDLSMVLFATTNGWAPELRSTERTWSLDNSPIWLLRMLGRRSGEDPFVAAAFKSAAPAIRQRLADSRFRSNWDARKVIETLDVVAPRATMRDVIRTFRKPSDRDVEVERAHRAEKL